MKKIILMMTIVSMMVLNGCASVSVVDKEKVQKDVYILESDTRIITEVDLSNLNETELEYAYEEIYARHGKIYADANYEKYFNAQDWYSPNPAFSEKELTVLEAENAEYISDYINSKNSVPILSHDHEKEMPKYEEEYYYRHFHGDNTFIIPDSSIRRLTVRELYGYSSNTLALIRNEIYARNGYIFSKQKYKDYFSSKLWYSPNPNFNENWLTSIEKYNIQLIKSLE